MKPYSFLAGILLLSSSVSTGQTNQSRIEIDLKDNFEKINVLPLNETNLLVQSSSIKSSKGQTELKNDFYNDNLQLIDSKSILVKDRTQVLDTYQENGVNYSLIRNKRDYLAIITTDANNKSVKKIETTYTDDGYLSEMKVFNNKAIFKSTINKENKIIIIDLNTGELKEVSFKFEKFRKTDIKIEDFQVVDNEILVFVNVKNSRKSSDLYIANIDLNGNQKNFYKITENIDEKLIRIAATKIDNKYILTGTYSKTKSDASQGIFFGEVENQNLNFIKFYNFTDLSSFKDLLSEKEQKIIERKIEAANSKDKELMVNYLIKMHPINKIDDGYLFLGESYFPTYIVYSSGRGGYHQQFDGYRYTHAIVAKFDNQGNLIWDNSLEIKPDYKPMKLVEFVTLDTQNDVNLTFANLDEVSYKRINKTTGQTLVNKTTEIIESTFQADQVKKSMSKIDHWHNNYYIVYGNQTVSNKEIDRKRKIYFINKLKLQQN